MENNDIILFNYTKPAALFKLYDLNDFVRGKKRKEQSDRVKQISFDSLAVQIWEMFESMRLLRSVHQNLAETVNCQSVERVNGFLILVTRTFASTGSVSK